MRVVCSSLNDFINNLPDSRESVWRGTVHVDVTRQPLDGENRHNAVKFAVIFHASAIVDDEQDGQYFLDLGLNCGVDLECSDPRTDASDLAESLRRKLVEHCDDRGLTVKPGVLTD